MPLALQVRWQKGMFFAAYIQFKVSVNRFVLLDCFQLSYEIIAEVEYVEDVTKSVDFVDLLEDGSTTGENLSTNVDGCQGAVNEMSYAALKGKLKKADAVIAAKDMELDRIKIEMSPGTGKLGKYMLAKAGNLAMVCKKEAEINELKARLSRTDIIMADKTNQLASLKAELVKQKAGNTGLLEANKKIERKV